MGLLTGRQLVITESAVHQLDKNHAWVEFYWDFHATFKEGNQPLHTKGRESQLLIKKTETGKLFTSIIRPCQYQVMGKDFKIVLNTPGYWRPFEVILFFEVQMSKLWPYNHFYN